MKTMFPILGMLGLMTGCGAPSTHLEVFLAPTLDANMAEQALTALHGWEEVSNHDIVFTIKYGEPEIITANQIVIHAVTMDYIQHRCDHKWVGCTIERPFNSADVYVVTDKANQPYSLHTMYHEIGHALRLKHSDKGTVMCADNFCAAPLPTCADLQQFASIHHSWNPSEVNGVVCQ